MGIQIVSALAKVYSEVATRAGLQLKGVRLPDPQEEPSNYVNEVISLWSAGHSHLPPTWRELLDVLQDVGLLELSQQIEAYMEGEFFFLLESCPLKNSDCRPYLLHDE